MSEIRTLERCGKPAGSAGRPCMRVTGHLGDCIPAMLNAEELAALDNQINLNSAVPFRIGPPKLRLPKLPAVYLVILAGLVCIIALQAWIDAYVMATIIG